MLGCYGCYKVQKLGQLGLGASFGFRVKGDLAFLEP